MIDFFLQEKDKQAKRNLVSTKPSLKRILEIIFDHGDMDNRLYDSIGKIHEARRVVA